MKEFERYFKEYFKPNKHCTLNSEEFKKTGTGFEVYVSMKQAWMAALKWIDADLKAARDGFDLGMHDTLKKELGEAE